MLPKKERVKILTESAIGFILLLAIILSATMHWMLALFIFCLFAIILGVALGIFIPRYIKSVIENEETEKYPMRPL